MRGLFKIIIHSLLSEIVASYEGWLLAREATFRGTIVVANC